jgi:Ca-activated chloride channel family protein
VRNPPARRALPFPLALPLALLIISLASCARIPGKLRIIEGGFHHAGGRYLQAIEAYRRALAYPDAAPYAEYGLGVIYLSMNEDEEAAARFEAALALAAALPPAGHRELLRRAHYNTGVIRFQRGDYNAAAASFRRALEADGGSVDAKRNLELSLLSRDRPAPSAASPISAPENSGSSGILFDYIRRKERDKWASRVWTEDAPPAGADY